MTKTFCDRCGEPIPPGNLYFMKTKEVVRRVIFFTPVGIPREFTVPTEICQNCMNDFYNWWAQGKEDKSDVTE